MTNDMDIIKYILNKRNIQYTINPEYPNHIGVEGGYIGFVSYLIFDEQGNLQSIEAYE